jgi:hypothetical protein
VQEHILNYQELKGLSYQMNFSEGLKNLISTLCPCAEGFKIFRYLLEEKTK